jgi:hypothetical protein
MNVAAGVLHDALDVVAAFPNDVRMLRVRHVHLQSHPRTLEREKGRLTFMLIHECKLNALY